MGSFVPGRELAAAFYGDVVAPLVGEIEHSAALLGWGSDVLGYDTARSTDHGWGPRLQLFVAAENVDLIAGVTTRDWLSTPQQLLLEVTSGPVFHDGLRELERVRRALDWYPDDVWRWLLACQWRRIDQDEPFVGRTAEVGDDLGSRVIASRLVRDLVRLSFLLEREYAPYSKWLGSAFRRLNAGAAIGDALVRALAAGDYPTREALLDAPRRST